MPWLTSLQQACPPGAPLSAGRRRRLAQDFCVWWAPTRPARLAMAVGSLAGGGAGTRSPGSHNPPRPQASPSTVRRGGPWAIPDGQFNPLAASPGRRRLDDRALRAPTCVLVPRRQGPIIEGVRDRGLDALSPPLQPTGAGCVRASGTWHLERGGETARPAKPARICALHSSLQRSSARGAPGALLS